MKEWYTEQDSRMATALDRRDQLQNEMNASNDYTPPPRNTAAYREYQAEMIRRSRNQQDNYREMERQGHVAGRIQMAMNEVRYGIQRTARLNYDWFKIRTTNNFGKY